METIKLEKDNILRIGILDSENNDTGEFLEFDLEDTELALRYKNMLEKEERNIKWINTQLKDIRGKADVKGKYMTKNQEDEFKVWNEFYKREKEIFDMFLGEGGCDKLLGHKKFGWNAPKKINKIITEQIRPYLEKQMDIIANEVEDMFKDTDKGNVM